MGHAGRAEGVRIKTGVQPCATQRQRVSPLDPVEIVRELVYGIIPDVGRDIGNPGTDQGRIDDAVALIFKAVWVGIDEEILAVTLDAEAGVIDHVRTDGPIHRGSRYVRRG